MALWTLILLPLKLQHLLHTKDHNHLHYVVHHQKEQNLPLLREDSLPNPFLNPLNAVFPLIAAQLGLFMIILLFQGMVILRLTIYAGKCPFFSPLVFFLFLLLNQNNPSFPLFHRRATRSKLSSPKVRSREQLRMSLPDDALDGVLYNSPPLSPTDHRSGPDGTLVVPSLTELLESAELRTYLFAFARTVYQGKKEREREIPPPPFLPSPYYYLPR